MQDVRAAAGALRLDGNGVINGADLAGLLVNWGTVP